MISSQRIFKTGPLETINYEVLNGGDDCGTVVLSVPEVNRNIGLKRLGIHGANLFMYYSTCNDCLRAWITRNDTFSSDKQSASSTATQFMHQWCLCFAASLNPCPFTTVGSTSSVGNSGASGCHQFKPAMALLQSLNSPRAPRIYASASFSLPLTCHASRRLQVMVAAKEVRTKWGRETSRAAATITGQHIQRHLLLRSVCVHIYIFISSDTRCSLLRLAAFPSTLGCRQTRPISVLLDSRLDAARQLAPSAPSPTSHLPDPLTARFATRLRPRLGRPGPRTKPPRPWRLNLPRSHRRAGDPGATSTLCLVPS
ncbi:hypothetical protein NL676_023495 [Syzygium grande]|nr:hypothetical protein NL676_023495 [Syzygium grande]